VLAVVVPLVMGRIVSGAVEPEGLLGGVSVRDIDDHKGVVSPRQEMTRAEQKRQSKSNNSTNWNDVQANSIGVNEALGWDYDFCRIEWPRSEYLVFRRTSATAWDKLFLYLFLILTVPGS